MIIVLWSSLSNEECRQESAKMRQSLSYDPEVAVATAPNSQLEEDASKASQNEDQYKQKK